jgi:hypothetical protein
MLERFWKTISDTHNPDNNLGPLLMAVVIACIVTLMAVAVGMA